MDSDLMTIKKSSEFGTGDRDEFGTTDRDAVGTEAGAALDIKQGKLILFETGGISFAGRGIVHAQDP